MAEKPLQDLVARLERERLEADRRYNDALTALDAASRALADGGRAPGAARAPVPYDASQLPRVNERWKILGDGFTPPPPPGLSSSLKERLRAFVWRMVGPALQSQQAFNAALVDHLNRNVGAHAEASAAIDDVRAALSAEAEARARFQSALVAYLQTITEYVDTKDRALGGPELREQIVLANERAMALKRDLDRLGGGLRTQGSGAGAESRSSPEPRAQGPGPTDFSYVGFEDRFRGSQESIRARLEDYVPLFTPVADDTREPASADTREPASADTREPASAGNDVLDVGCGRGELLALLSEAGVPARGIDVNGEMVALCRERGFNAEQADALTYLESLPDASLGGLTAIQVVEHLEPAYLARFLEAAFHKLRPGSPIVLETINPACWMAFFEAYIRDLTHAQPIHPDTLRFLVQASGFSSVDVQLRSPVSERDRLENVNWPDSAEPPALREAIAALNAHADKLNARLFGFMDYAVIARR